MAPIDDNTFGIEDAVIQGPGPGPGSEDLIFVEIVHDRSPVDPTENRQLAFYAMCLREMARKPDQQRQKLEETR